MKKHYYESQTKEEIKALWKFERKYLRDFGKSYEIHSKTLKKEILENGKKISFFVLYKEKCYKILPDEKGGTKVLYCGQARSWLPIIYF